MDRLAFELSFHYHRSMDEKEVARIVDLADENLDQALQELDEMIAHEDPEFAKSLSTISIDNSLVQPVPGSVGQEAIAKVFKPKVSVMTRLKVLVDYKANPKKVISFWSGVFVVATLAGFSTVTKFWVRPSKLFITSLGDLGGEVIAYDLEKDTESFFENPKLSRNLVSISRMVANLKPGANSSVNPMVALELTVEGMNTEVVIEIKDREAEFKDKILRVVESQTYDRLDVEAGKLDLALRIRDEMNANLTRGQVRKVLYKSFVIKR